MIEKKPTVTALAPWYGSNRILGHRVGELLKGCKWVGVPFAGGMAELSHIDARTIAVNDLHRHVMNLACFLSLDDGPQRIASAASSFLFHPDVLGFAQNYCLEMERAGWDLSNASTEVCEKWALNYFICCWMGRSAKAGTDDEFKGGLPVRWNANGGDSNTRYRSAIESLEAWGAIMRRCNFTTLDFREFLGKCKDEAGHGIYCDPPFPGPGDKYKHKFSEQDHRALAFILTGFHETRVVCRFYDHPLIRELYPEALWEWQHLDGGRKQSNSSAPEVLLLNSEWNEFPEVQSC